jgi:hypothetical protein
MMTLVHIYIIFIQLMMRLHCVTPLRVLDLPIVSLKVVTWAQSVNVSTYAMGHRIMLEEDTEWIGGQCSMCYGLISIMIIIIILSRS